MKRNIIISGFIIIYLFTQIISLEAQILNTPHIIENKGQYPDEILFMALTPDMRVTVTNQKIICIYDIPTFSKYSIIYDIQLQFNHDKLITKDILKFSSKLETYYNFFIGSDSKKWATDVGLYRKVETGLISDTYRFTAEFLNNELVIKYQFTNKTDYNNFKIDEKIIDKTKISKDILLKQIIFRDESKNLIQIRLPFKDIEKTNNLKGKILDEDMSQLVFSRRFGGYISDMAIDGDGNIIVFGHTDEKNIPTTDDAYLKEKPSQEGRSTFISRLSPNSKHLKYSTFFGAIESYDNSNSLCIDEITGDIYIIGCTSNSKIQNDNNFPTTNNAYLKTRVGGNDLFLARFTKSGNKLIFSTLMGGSSEDTEGKLSIREGGIAIFAATTTSKDYPLTDDAFFKSIKGGKYSDITITSLNTNTGELIFSTFYGGSGYDRIIALKLDSKNNIIIAGNTRSNDFPTTDNAFRYKYLGLKIDIPKGFIIKVKSDYSDIIFSTLFVDDKDGATNIEDVIIDEYDNIYLCGFAENNIPITSNNLGYRILDEQIGLFISKFDEYASNLIFSSVIASSVKYKYCYAFKLIIDDRKNIWIAGATNFDNYPITESAYNKDYRTMFLTKLNPDATVIIYSTFYGGYYWDTDWLPWLDQCINKIYAKDETLVIAGFTIYDNFPYTTDSKEFGEGSYITKFDFTNVSVKDESLITRYGNIIRPNPASDYIEVAMPTEQMTGDAHQVRIYNMLGQCVINYELRSTNNEAKAKIDIRHLPAGLYYICIGGKGLPFVKN